MKDMPIQQNKSKGKGTWPFWYMYELIEHIFWKLSDSSAAEFITRWIGRRTSRTPIAGGLLLRGSMNPVVDHVSIGYKAIGASPFDKTN